MSENDGNISPIHKHRDGVKHSDDQAAGQAAGLGTDYARQYADDLAEIRRISRLMTFTSRQQAILTERQDDLLEKYATNCRGGYSPESDADLASAFERLRQAIHAGNKEAALIEVAGISLAVGAPS